MGAGVRVNLTSKVNSRTIRRTEYNGRPHWVVPSHTLPFDVVMNGVLYPRATIETHYSALEGTAAPLGHPQANGKYISARSPEGINLGWCGAWNRNAKLAGNRVYVEKWIDVDVAQRSAEGRRLLDRLSAMERGEDVPPIHTSVAVYVDLDEVPEDKREALGYDAVATLSDVDHDAILLDEIGAATPEQGVGMMVNTSDAQPLRVHRGVLRGESFRQIEEMLNSAAQQQFGTSEQYAWVADFTDEQAVVIVGTERRVYEYSIEAGRVRFADQGTPVEQQTSWVARLPVVNRVLEFFRAHRIHPNPNEDEAMTKEEREQLLAEVGTLVSNTVKPLTDAMGALQAENAAMRESLTANERAQETEMRKAVAGKFGDVVANALSGDALRDMHAKCNAAAPIGQPAGTTVVNSAEAPDPATYLPEGR